MISRVKPGQPVMRALAVGQRELESRRDTVWTVPGAVHGAGKRPPLALIVPSLLVAAAVLLPLFYLVVRVGGADARTWASIARPRTLSVLVQTILLTVSVTIGALGLGVPLAWLTARTDLRWRRFWTIAAALPLAVPSYLTAFAFVAALGPRGMLQRLLAPLGVERLPEIYGFWGALLVLTLVTYPYVLISVRAGLREMDPALEEAARSLGNGPWQLWWRVTLPQLRPSIVAGALLVALYTLSDFGVVSLLQYDSLTRAIYLGYQASFNRTIAAILGLLLMLVAAALVAGEMRVRGRARYYRVSPGSCRPPRPIRLGRWQWAALAGVAPVVMFAAGLPLAVVVYWAWLAIGSGEPWRSAAGAMLNTFYVAGLSAIVVVLAALPVALLAVRYPGRLGRLAEQVSYIGHVLPGIVIALALVFFAARYAAPIYQTLPLLVFAYLVRFLPQGVGSARAAVLRIDPRVEEAARSLGGTPWSVLRTITLPLLSPGLMSAAVLVSLTTMKELPATLLLSPIGFETLATQVWAATGEAFFTRAAWPALLLMLLAVIPTALLTLGERAHDA